MGYHTEFWGEFEVTPELSAEHALYLKQFAETRRMKRDAAKAATRPDPIREAVGLPIGIEGGYFVNGEGFKGQNNDDTTIDGNNPPAGQPGLWCQWVPAAMGATIEWDGGEKFYEYIPWLKYLILHFLTPWGYELNGEVNWSGEEDGDTGKIKVVKNVVFVSMGELYYSPFILSPIGDR